MTVDFNKISNSEIDWQFDINITSTSFIQKVWSPNGYYSFSTVNSSSVENPSTKILSSFGFSIITVPSKTYSPLRSY